MFIIAFEKKLKHIVIENTLENIKKIRLRKGFSHEYLAHKLDISQVAYSKLEKNETKLNVERLFKIAEILETSVGDLLSENNNTVYNQDIKDNGMSHQQIQNLYEENKGKTEKIISLYEARLKDKESLITALGGN